MVMRQMQFTTAMLPEPTPAECPSYPPPPPVVPPRDPRGHGGSSGPLRRRQPAQQMASIMYRLLQQLCASDAFLSDTGMQAFYEDVKPVLERWAR